MNPVVVGIAVKSVVTASAYPQIGMGEQPR